MIPWKMTKTSEIYHYAADGRTLGERFPTSDWRYGGVVDERNRLCVICYDAVEKVGDVPAHPVTGNPEIRHRKSH